MANEQEIKVPDIGDFDEVDVIEVLVQPGDQVEQEQSLITLESDKATMEVPSPMAGTIKSIKISPGDKVAKGSVIGTLAVSEETATKPAEKKKEEEEPLRIEEPEEDPMQEEPREDQATAESPTPPPAPAGTSRRPPPVDEKIDAEAHRRAHASPAVRLFARELGVDLSQVSGSGRKGRILREDVAGYVKQTLESGAPAAAGAGIPSIPPVDFEKFGPVERQPLSRIKKLSGPHLHRSWLNIPHVTQFDEADITELEAFRKAEKAQAEKRGVKLTPLAFLVKASAAALREFPAFNSSLAPEGDALILKHYVHIGVAVDTPEGLVVPVLRDVDRKGIYEIATELGELSQKARDKKLGPNDLQGGCFSISSLGGIGGTAFTPIVNAPEVAILGVSRSAMKPVWDGNEFVPRLMLPLSLSYDHRVIDGAAAARFATYLSGLLADIRRLLL
ncbi:branched-chain alpha-keto acid dehydrogenase subunit E2 [Alkalilimnicola ehrlichii]|uniref:Dihydrolipoamide acetyltransferase component of pyruvate dehydrogenase complex n=1 Tax=Alkalilimnicola ehrlichii TaxID=351052 RepID=A0A3E0WH92_9GAMM|nr:dihydrolipoyllysine-residue acetyltransferase [Alkalilimnicola ehrlichii]RFA27245.1 branched-chain alpha-keto acid dehydrogenase subunit E2 [Alkalilimnicola ehrlichii]RFA31541.1 branched-chain alpha-keto acid dehydrogenase subunit E2 [Alkalilimnicola ehrlichii]